MFRQRNYTVRVAAARGSVVSTWKSVVVVVLHSAWRSLVKRG